MVYLWMCARIAELWHCGMQHCGTFFQMHPQFSEYTAYSRQKMPQSAVQDVAVRRSHQSVAHTVGEKWCM